MCFSLAVHENFHQTSGVGRTPNLIPLDFFLWDHMSPVDSEEDLAQVLAAAEIIQRTLDLMGHMYE